jgi:dTDP-4-dehydrorhamnose reductase
MSERILVTGGAGLVGSRFSDYLSEHFEPIAPDSKELDIRDKESLRKFIKETKPSLAIHFAAFTNVDQAEKEKGDKDGLAWQLNVEGSKNLAQVCADQNIFMTHLSTDFIFSGTPDFQGPYKEDALGNDENISWYGLTKKRSEEEVKKACPQATIVRISYPYRARYDRKTDFARNILTLFDQGKLYPLFIDQVLTPTFIDDACSVLCKLLRERISGEVFHIVSKDLTSPFEFGNYLLLRARGVKGAVVPSSMQEFMQNKVRTPRPRLGGLLSQKTQEKLGLNFPSWQESVDKMIRQL